MAQNDFSLLSCLSSDPPPLCSLLDHQEVTSFLEDLVALIDTPFVIEDLDENSLFGQHLATATEQFPVTVHQHIIGFVKGDNKVPIIGRLLSSWLNKELLVFFDELTQIPNRRYFNQYMQQQWGSSQRETQPLSLLLCDLDFFKFYNDFYGHKQGDLCLKQVAQVLKAVLKRPADLVFRYGGEEFAILLPNTSIVGAQIVAAQLVKGVEQQKLPHNLSEVSAYVTLSIGVSAVIPTQQLASDTLFHQADMALYEAKKTGRNCYCVATNLPTNHSSLSQNAACVVSQV